MTKIETAILSALEQTPPELYADIVLNGIYLAGGGALLRGLDKRLTDKINIPFHIAEDPLLSVAKGTGIALKNVDRSLFDAVNNLLMRQFANLLMPCGMDSAVHWHIGKLAH